MGAIFAVALARVQVPDAAGLDAAGTLGTAGMPGTAGEMSGTAGAPDAALLPGERIALVAGVGEPLAELCARLGDASGGARALTLLVGSERFGLPEELVEACEHVAHIPIAAESLNAAMAATVALYETTTRRFTRVRTS
jgi:TrmH family RNA methyltransferase